MSNIHRASLAAFISIVASVTAVGCSASPGSSGGGACVAEAHSVTSVDPNSAGVIRMRGSYIYLPPSSTREPLVRVAIASGAKETLETSNAGVFAANDADAVVWLHGTAATASLEWLGPDREARDLPLPGAIEGVLGLALDSASNVFVLANDVKGGNSVWRYSAQRNAFDMLHHNIGSLTGFYEDASGVGWLGPSTKGLALYHEDVTGGAPTVSATLDLAGVGPYSGNPVIGLDATSLYVSSGSYITAIDRTTGKSKDLVNVVPTPASASIIVDASSIVVDDLSFYWVERDRVAGTASIVRTAKSGTGSVDTLTTIADLQTLAVGGCTLAYVGATDSSDWQIFARPK